VARSVRSFQYQPARGRFRDWLAAVTRSKLARFHAKRQREVSSMGSDEAQEVLDSVAAPAADADWTAEFNAQILRTALARIRAHFESLTWRAFELAWLDNRSAVEVARELNLPVDAIYVAKSRVLKRLKEEILLLADDLPQLAS
jgi:RNA polymerase sigma-70 factor (ECF subfamily)